nr:immunoglobulin heavy chain junction region [Macaca mulatta]MOV89443.1 immunoglobulin heavy chain junction region [Macaca mulatta]
CVKDKGGYNIWTGYHPIFDSW